MPTLQTLEYSDLACFTGTEQVYHNSFNTICYTDGVRYLAHQTGAYWLIDCIASYQPKLQQNLRLQDFQLWIFSQKTNKALEPNDGREFPNHLPSPDHHAIISCWSDSPDDWYQWQNHPLLVIKQAIPRTNFPLAELKLYVCLTEIGNENRPLLLLPSEY